jgi:hypothetical protein
MRSRGELNNNSRKPRGLPNNRHCGNPKKGPLTLSQGMVEIGDDVAVDDDDDVARTSGLQTPVTATLHTDELFLRTQYI